MKKVRFEERLEDLRELAVRTPGGSSFQARGSCTADNRAGMSVCVCVCKREEKRKRKTEMMSEGLPDPVA